MQSGHKAGAVRGRAAGQAASRRAQTTRGRAGEERITHRSRHCLPLRWGRKEPMRDHFRVPNFLTSVIMCSSSSGVHFFTTRRLPSSEESMGPFTRLQVHRNTRALRHAVSGGLAHTMLRMAGHTQRGRESHGGPTRGRARGKTPNPNSYDGTNGTCGARAHCRKCACAHRLRNSGTSTGAAARGGRKGGRGAATHTRGGLRALCGSAGC